MSPLPDACSYLTSHDEACGRQPVEADYVLVDAMKGEKLVVSVCRRHDTPQRKEEALRRGLARRERSTDNVVPFAGATA